MRYELDILTRHFSPPTQLASARDSLVLDFGDHLGWTWNLISEGSPSYPRLFTSLSASAVLVKVLTPSCRGLNDRSSLRYPTIQPVLCRMHIIDFHHRYLAFSLDCCFPSRSWHVIIFRIEYIQEDMDQGIYQNRTSMTTEYVLSLVLTLFLRHSPSKPLLSSSNNAREERTQRARRKYSERSGARALLHNTLDNFGTGLCCKLDVSSKCEKDTEGAMRNSPHSSSY